MKRSILMLACLLFTLTAVAPAVAEPAAPGTPAGGIKSIEERVKALEESAAREVESDKWYDRLQLSGLVEVEAGYANLDYDDPAADDEKSTDVDLATVEVALDAKIAAHVDGHLLFKWENGDSGDVFVDEGFITLTGSDQLPAYLIAGRQYVPFGNFESHFVTDPNTLVLGETNDGAVVIGYRLLDEMIDVSAGAFNGAAQKAGDDDEINSFVAAVTAQPMETLNVGVSYTSNLAGSGGLNEQLVDAESLDALVGGWSAFVTWEFLERFKLIGEYVAALDKFKAGEVYDAADTKQRQPTAWNIELGMALGDNLELALRYGGADDGGAEFLPESQYGAVVNWGFLDYTNLAVEYLHGEYEADSQKTDVLTVQLAVEF